MSKSLPQRNDAVRLRKAKALIDKPQKWHRGAYLGDTRRCMLQAVDDVAPMSRIERWLREAIREAEGHTSIVDFNDHHTHAEVMAMYDRAIVLAESA